MVEVGSLEQQWQGHRRWNVQSSLRVKVIGEM